MGRLLVCPPDYFGIEYEINPWMRIANAADADRSRAQWRELIRVLQEEVGVTLEWIEPVPGLPDLVFTANAGVVVGSKIVPSRFRHPERQREEQHFEKWFEEKGYEVIRLDPDLYFEGAGDLLGFPDIGFGGYRQRSDILAYAQLSTIFGKEILPLELVDSYFYHLDTCFCPLSRGELLYYPAAFDSYAQTAIANHIDEKHRLVAPKSEAARFACNAVCVDRHVVLPSGCPQTVALLEARGYHAHAVELDEFMKAGGSAKCLTLALD